MEDAVEISLDDCWAKTDPDSGQPALNVKDHCFIVGGVAEVLLRTLPPALRAFLPQGAVALVASHDIGKLTPGFQLKCSFWKYCAVVGEETPFRNGLETNHAAVSRSHLQFSSQFALNRKAALWLISTLGHHGRYFDGFDRALEPSHEGGNDRFVPLRDQLLHLLVDRFGPLPVESAKNEIERVHLLTGFTIFADWIGSNTDWFPLNLPLEANTVAWRTQRTLDDLGRTSPVISDLEFDAQFRESGSDKALTPLPLQSALVDAADSPGLYILEAPMGTGKTEAALSTAYRRWTEGEERGLYFALPTQLTSEKIHDRIHAFLRNTLGDRSVQSLIHGNAWLSEQRNRELFPRFPEADPEQPEADHNDTDEALRWFSSTRRQLLAPYGTGTIDQALLAILPARFAALRYFALAGKVVVIDEVHSYDPYMSSLVDRLIRYLLKTGSTVIVLSATLTTARRAQLVEAAGGSETDPPKAYPLITKVVERQLTHIEVKDDSPSKTVELVHHTLNGQSSLYWQSVANAVAAGANVVVIRNTVALAQETFCLLRSLLTSSTDLSSSGLLHSRFPQWQRREQEDRWVRLLSKEEALRPRGSLLVSTQIVEQSVDIDADLLVTDLAPADLILQRIGRLHRHPRARPEGFGQARCHILHPEVDWQGSAQEIKPALAPHCFIYPPLALWRSSAYLSATSAITLPSAIRDILEEVSKLFPDETSGKGLQEFVRDAEEQMLRQIGTARNRDVFNASAIDDREGTETRYNIRPTAQLIILQKLPVETQSEIRVTPLYGKPIELTKGTFSYPLAKALHLNAVRLPAHLVREQVRQSPDWLSRHIDGGVLAIYEAGRTELDLPAGGSQRYQLHYRPDLGVTSEKIATETLFTEPEDFWF